MITRIIKAPVNWWEAIALAFWLVCTGHKARRQNHFLVITKGY